MYFIYFLFAYLFIYMTAQEHNASYNDEQKNRDYDNNNDDSLVAYPEGSMLCLSLGTTLTQFPQSPTSKDYLSKILLDPTLTSLFKLPLDCCPKLTPPVVFMKLSYLNCKPRSSWPLKYHCSKNSTIIGGMNKPNCTTSSPIKFLLYLSLLDPTMFLYTL